MKLYQLALILFSVILSAWALVYVTEPREFADRSTDFVDPTSTPLVAVDNATTTEVFALTNHARYVAGLHTLDKSPDLMSAAQSRASYFCTNKFAHEDGDVNPWLFFDGVGYQYAYAGENLAKDFADVERMQNAWMASPLHRANVLDERYEEIGVGTACGKVVVLFGTRK